MILSEIRGRLGTPVMLLLLSWPKDIKGLCYDSPRKEKEDLGLLKAYIVIVVVVGAPERVSCCRVQRVKGVPICGQADWEREPGLFCYTSYREETRTGCVSREREREAESNRHLCGTIGGQRDTSGNASSCNLSWHLGKPVL